MKKWGMMLLALALLAGMTAARADSIDFAPYTLEDGAANDYIMLNEHDLVGQCSALDGSVWWRDRAVYRTFHMEQGMGNYLLLPRSDGTCGAVHISKEEDTSRRKVVLYDWEEEGLVNGREIPVTRPVRYDVVKDGMALLDDNGSQTLLKLYDGYGNLEAQIEVSREIDFVIGSVRVGPSSWLTRVCPRMKGDSYLLLMIRDGAVVWQKGPGKENPSPRVFPDGQGGFFIWDYQDDSTYNPLVLTRYDENGNQLWRKTLKGNKVVLGTASTVSSLDRETGQTVLAGTAMANSRKVYRVYRMEVDDQGKTVSMDVRESDYHNRIYYNVHVFPDTGNTWVLFDEALTYPYDYPAALVSFEALPKADNPGIELR
jgi:hypothetical protein